MLRAAVVEPQKEKRAMIVEGLNKLDLGLVTNGYSNEYDLLESMDEDCTSYDILVLNTTIRKEGDGIDLAGKIRAANRKAMICFLTESPAYYAEAFRVFATGYMLYPLHIEELYNCISFFFQMTKVEKRASLMLKENGGAYKRIYCRNIFYIESSNREIILHLDDGSSFSTYLKLNEVQQLLPEVQFLRCHQSYIINLYFVDQIQRSEFEIQGMAIPISRKYQAECKQAYYDYMFSKM